MAERHFMGLWREAVAELAPDATARGVAHAIGTFMNERGECFPSVGSIARRSGYSERAVRPAIQRLEIAGLLRVARSRGRDSHRYAASLPNPEAASGSTANELQGCGLLTRNLTSSTRNLTTLNPEPASGEGDEGDEGVTGLPERSDPEDVRRLLAEAGFVTEDAP